MSTDTPGVQRAAAAGPSLVHAFASTEDLPPNQRFDFWRNRLVKRYEPFGPADSVRQAFDARVRKLIAPEGEFTELRWSPVGITRTKPLLRADGHDTIVLSLMLTGGGAGWYGDADRATPLTLGRLRIRDQVRPYVLQFTGTDNHSVHLEIPRASFDRRTLARVAAASGTLTPPTGLAPLLVAQMRAFAEIAGGLDAAGRVAGLRSAVELATTLLRLEYGSLSAESEVCGDGMLVAAQALIAKRFAETDLSPDSIAHRLGCSRAHLYRVFGRHGLSVAGYVREIRLQRAHAALTIAGPRDTVGNIAFRSGFENPVYFAHIFYQRFGIRPSEVLRRDGASAGD